MTRLVLIAAFYVALTASFVGRAAQPSEGAAGTSQAPATSPAAETAHGGASHHLSLGRVLWVPEGSASPQLERRMALRN